MDELEIQPINKLTLIDHIIEVISNLISEGKLKPGDALPSERKLSEMLKISRNSVRQAIKALSVLGVLKTRAGSPTYLNKSISKLFTNPFKFVSILHNIKAIELFETREMLEVKLVKLAAEKATNKDIERINSILEKGKVFLNNPEEFSFLESEFHNAIFKAARNRLLAAMMDSINEVLFERKKKSLLLFSDYKKILKQHTNIFAAIKNKDPDKAGKVMLEHLSDFLQYQKEIEHIGDKEVRILR